MPMRPNFRDLHQSGNPFLLANAWDAGSARLLAACGAQAIGTSSAAYGFTLGLPDGGSMSRDVALSHACDLAAAVNLPVSGDFENGFGDDPETCAETVRLSGEAGLAGICIEDTALPSDEAYDFDLAVERIRAAASAARSLRNDFMLFARADGVMTGTYDLTEALRRTHAFEEVGADGVYIPRLPSLTALGQVCAAHSVPVNALTVPPLTAHTRAEMAAVGVARISLGSTLARHLIRTLTDTATDMFKNGCYDRLEHTLSGNKIEALLEKGTR